MEHNEIPPTDQVTQDSVHCDECNTVVHLDRDSGGQLVLTCGCDHRLRIKVARVLPEGWQA